MSADGRRPGTTVVTAARDGLASRPGLHAVANTARGCSAALRPSHHRRDGQVEDVLLVIGSGPSGATIPGEKTSNPTEHVHVVHATIPAARFVHVVRNGLDVAASFAEADMSPLDVAARPWVRRTRIARRFAACHPEAGLTVRYEDLVTDPEPVVRSLAASLRLPPDTLDLERVDHVSAMVDVAARRSFEFVGEPITSARVDRWRDRMDPDELRVAAPIMRRELRHWGHDVVPEDAVTGDRGEPAGPRRGWVLWTARHAWATMRRDGVVLWEQRPYGASQLDGKRGHGPA